MGFLPDIENGKLVTKKPKRDVDSIVRFTFETLDKEKKTKVNALIQEKNIPLYSALKELGYLKGKTICIRK